MILAIDPGKMTGWARLRVGPSSFTAGQQPLYDTLHWIHETLKQGEQIDIVCEDFIFTRETLKKSRQMYSTEGIGALRFLAEEYDQNFFIQTPVSAKSFSTDSKLKLMGWWTPGQDHANDAARHLLLHAVEQRLIEPRLLIE